MDRYVWSEDSMIVDTTKPWHDPDQDPDTATDEPLYEEIDDTVDLLNDQDFEIIALRARVAALEAVAEAAKDTIMWAGEVCPEWPSMKHQDCAEHCGNRRVCAALAALDRGRA